jgi:hypothetical protein
LDDYPPGLTVTSEDMAKVFPGGLVPRHVGEVTAVVAAHPPDPDGVDWLRIQELKKEKNI